MSTPEPLDEHPAGGVEIRGGDRPADYLLRSDVMFHAQEDLLPCSPESFLTDEELVAAVRAHDAECDCDDGVPE
jgi:hypothetical protein